MDVNTLPPTEKEALAASVAEGNATRVAVGMKLREFRETYNVPRSLLAEAAGMNKTSILRIENGQYSMTAYTLPRVLMAARRIVQTLYPMRISTINKWVWEMLELAMRDSEEQRKRKQDAGRRGYYGAR